MAMDESLLALLKVIGRNMKQRRKELGISQRKLAEIVGISRGYVARIETARDSPSLKTLYMISIALEISAADLCKE